MDKKAQKRKEREKRLKAERSRQIQAADADWHLDVATTAYHLRDYAKALFHVENALRIRPEWTRGLRIRAALAVKYQGDFGIAIPLLEKIIRKDEEDSYAIFQLANCYFQQERYAEEIDLLEKYQKHLKGRRDKAAREENKKVQDWLAETRFQMTRAAAMSSTSLTPETGIDASPVAATSQKDPGMGSPRQRAGETLRGESSGNQTGETERLTTFTSILAAMNKLTRRKGATTTRAEKESPRQEEAARSIQTSLFSPDEELPGEKRGKGRRSSRRSDMEDGVSKPPPVAAMSASPPAAPDVTTAPPADAAPSLAAAPSVPSAPVHRSVPPGRSQPAFAGPVPSVPLQRPDPAAPTGRSASPAVLAPADASPDPGGPAGPSAPPVAGATPAPPVAGTAPVPAPAPPGAAPAPAPELPPLDLTVFSDPRNLHLEAPVHIREAAEDFAARVIAAPPAAPEDYLLHLQYRRLRLVREFEELLCLDQLRGVNHYWYQVETVAAVLKRFRGRVLLADEVGLGKTIEAGMLIKEYLLRGLVRKVLILTPPTLVSQWREEMEEKFSLPFVTPENESFRSEGERFWRDRDLVIASINMAKSQRHFDVITDIDYDLVVVDEAHYLRNRKTRNHRLVGALRKRFIFLLSATPVQNNLLELYNLITLLQPGLLSTEAAFKREYVKRGNLRQPQNPEKLRQLLREVMVRNTRSMVDVKLPKRFAATFYVPPTAVEKETYEELSAALRRYHEGTAAPEVFTIRNLQMAAGSSPFALRESLERLCARLAAVGVGSGMGKSGGSRDTGGGVGINDGLNGGSDDGARRGDGGNGGLGKGGRGRDGGLIAGDWDGGMGRDKEGEEDDAEREAAAAGRPGVIGPDNGNWRALHDLFTGISGKLAGIGETSKGRQLLSLVGQNQEKKLIFVRYRRTLAYLEELLRQNGYPCAIFSGDMTAREKDEAVAAFREDVPILLSTETGGEGRNIQFCNTLINYDLPWNPMRLEQRIGRVHRIGQERDVFIFNLCLQGSIEDYMMRILDDKINMFELVIGEIDTILGNLDTEHDFAGLILDAWLRSGAEEERQANFARLGEEILAAKRSYEKTKALDEMIFGDDYEV